MPVIFTIGSYNVYSFGFFLALSFLLSTFVIWRYAREEFKEEEYLDAYFYGFMTALVTARVVYIIRNFADFGFNFLQYILVTETPGLSMMGGVIGSFLFLLYYSSKKKLKFWHILDLFSLSGSLALMFIKIGQQLGGAAFGRETEFFLKVRIIGLPKFHHTAEFYEAFFFLLIFLLLIYLYKKAGQKKWPEGLVFSVFSLLLGMQVFALEFLKVYRVYLYGLSFRQLLALGIIALSIANIIRILNLFKKIYHKKLT